MMITPTLWEKEDWDEEYITLRDQILLGLGRVGGGLPDPLKTEIGTTLQIVNSYYSNSMEGNPTKIGDIFKAREGNFLSSKLDRDYQKEHLAHIKVASLMKERLAKDPLLSPTSLDFLRFIHCEFYKALPKALQIAKTIQGKEIEVVPGDLRKVMVQVGSFAAPPPQELDACLRDFEKFFDTTKTEPKDYLTSLASAHHRFLWVHPFPDGNGRVVRLLTEAMLERMGYAGHGLYSISRGLARNRKEYDQALSRADQPRENNYDGRGNLSLKGLVFFCKFFLKVMQDQIEFMGSLLEGPQLERRFETFLATEKVLKKISQSEKKVLHTLFKLGEIQRGDIQPIADVQKRQASKISMRLLRLGYAQSPSPKGPLRIKINGELAKTLFPEFF